MCVAKSKLVDGVRKIKVIVALVKSIVFHCCESLSSLSRDFEFEKYDIIDLRAFEIFFHE